MKKLSLVFATLLASVAFTACNRGDTDTDIVIPAPKDRAVETISGKITTNTTWVESKKYSISGFVYVEAGATLTVEPGTKERSS
jgi:hypothetical protein